MLRAIPSVFMAVITAVVAVIIGVAYTDISQPDGQTGTTTRQVEVLPEVSPYMPYDIPIPPVYANGLTRDTGMDSQSCRYYDVCGTDLGVAVGLPDGRVIYLFGDTFAIPGPFMEHPEGADKYRAQAVLVADETPIDGKPIDFDGFMGIGQPGTAPELFGWQRTLTDGVSFAETGEVFLSWQSIVETEKGKPWRTRDAGFARSTPEGGFELIGPVWENNADNNDPFQMWSMARDGDYVYIVSVRPGRQMGPMMLFRVPWYQLLDKSAYTYWNGSDWSSQWDAASLFEERVYGEPSLRKLSDGTWVMAYVDYTRGPQLVTRTLVDNATGPSGAWNEPKVQLTWRQLPALYGGFIHPHSTPDNLILMVSTWQRDKPVDEDDLGRPIRYDVMHMIVNVW